MAQPYENNGPFTMTTGEDLVPDRLVKLSSNTIKYCDAGESPIGVAKGSPTDSGDLMAVQPLDGNIRKVTTSKAISAGSKLYAAADGKVSDAAVGNQLGLAITASSADGGKIAAIVWNPGSLASALNPYANIIHFRDDFFSYDNTATVGKYAEVSDAGTIGVEDGHGGILSIATGATDNNESYVSSITEFLKFQTDKNAFFSVRVKLTEANTDDANIIVGLSDTVAADSLLDDGDGPMASYDGAVFFKVDGGTVWQFESSNAGTQDTQTDVGDFDDGEWQVLEFLYDYNDGTTATITPYVDGTAGTAVDLTIAGLAEMHLLFGAKAGGGNAEALKVDMVDIQADR